MSDFAIIVSEIDISGDICRMGHKGKSRETYSIALTRGDQTQNVPH